MNSETLKKFGQFAIRVILLHWITYILFGLLMSNLFNYREIFEREIIRDFMLPIGSRTVWSLMAQPVRGLLFAAVIWPLRDFLLEKKHGWLILWSLFLVFGILSPPAAAPGSIEGVLYSKIPLWYHVIGIPEVALQTLAFSYLFIWWEKRQLARTGERKAPSGLISDLILAFVTACFAYIGYAVGSLAIFFLTPNDVDFDAAAGDMRLQFMFVAAFLVNIVYVFFISKQWVAGRIPLWAVFAFAWVLDSLVLFSYQTFVLGGSSLGTVFLIGLLPAVIIALTIRQNYAKFKAAG